MRKIAIYNGFFSRQTLGVCLLTLSFCAKTMLAAQAQSINYGSLEKLFGEPVTTSATGKPQRETEVPVTMVIVTAEDIRRSGATDIPGVLRHLAGLDVWRWSLGNADLSIRGYNQPMAPRILTLVNGRQVYLDLYGLTRWSTLPVALDEIRQIEVVKGPNSALYGFNAVSGVINIVTYNPLHDDEGAATLRGGTQNYMEGSVFATGRLGDNGGIRVSLGGYHGDDFETSAQEKPFATKPMRRWLSLDSLFQLSDDVQGGLELTHSKSRQLDYLPTYEPISFILDTLSAKGHASAETQLGWMTGTAYINHSRAEFAPTGIDRFEINNNLLVLKLEDLFKVGASNAFRLSGEYRHSSVNTTPIEGAVVYYDVFSASAMWDHQFSPSVSLVNAARIDHLKLARKGEVVTGFPFSNDDYDQTISAVSFFSGLTSKLSDHDTLRLSVSRGHQLPNLSEFSNNTLLTITGLPGAGTGNPELSPSPVTNYELSYVRDMPDSQASATASVFYQRSRSLRVTSTTTGDIFVAPYLPVGIATWNTVGSSESVGAEISFEGKINSRWDWGINYTFQTINDSFRVNDGATTTHGIDFENSISNHKLGLHGGYQHGDFEFDVFLNVVSGYDMLRLATPRTPNPYSIERVPAYATISARLGYHLGDGVTVSLTGQELPSHKETIGGDIEGRVLGTLSAKF